MADCSQVEGRRVARGRSCDTNRCLNNRMSARSWWKEVSRTWRGEAVSQPRVKHLRRKRLGIMVGQWWSGAGRGFGKVCRVFACCWTATHGSEQVVPYELIFGTPSRSVHPTFRVVATAEGAYYVRIYLLYVVATDPWSAKWRVCARAYSYSSSKLHWLALQIYSGAINV